MLKENYNLNLNEVIMHVGRYALQHKLNSQMRRRKKN